MHIDCSSCSFISPHAVEEAVATAEKEGKYTVECAVVWGHYREVGTRYVLYGTENYLHVEIGD